MPIRVTVRTLWEAVKSLQEANSQQRGLPCFRRVGFHVGFREVPRSALGSNYKSATGMAHLRCGRGLRGRGGGAGGCCAASLMRVLMAANGLSSPGSDHCARHCPVITNAPQSRRTNGSVPVMPSGGMERHSARTGSSVVRIVPGPSGVMGRERCCSPPSSLGTSRRRRRRRGGCSPAAPSAAQSGSAAADHSPEPAA